MDENSLYLPKSPEVKEPKTKSHKYRNFLYENAEGTV